MNEPKLIFLEPVPDEHFGDRDWCQDDVWEGSVRYVLESDARAIETGLRDELGAAKGEYDRAVNKVDALQHRLTAADERADDLSSAATKALDVLRSLLKVNACGVHYAAAQMACHQLSTALKSGNPRKEYIRTPSQNL